MLDKITRYQGCLIGLAVGDALGAPIQFKKRDTYVHVSGYISGGKFNSQKGEYTDDTSMALCLADSLINSKGFNAKNQLDTYVRWLKNGYMSTRKKAYDIGITILRSLTYYTRTGEIVTNLNQEKNSGNGSLMRLAPVVMFYANDLDSAVAFAEKSSLTTHASPIAVDACRYFAYFLTLILNGSQKSDLFNNDSIKEMKNYFKDKPLHPEIAKIANGSYLNKNREDIKSSGYVVHTLEAALWAFYNGITFKDTMLEAVNLGDDADTVGAVTGQLAGAYYGLDNINNIFLEELFNREFILDMSEKLYTQREGSVRNFVSV
nr:ADP-ribosylglycohydrolase family protein [uncultured Sulfurimonas sp.]